MSSSNGIPKPGQGQCGANASLLEMGERLEALFDSAPMGFALLDRDLRYVRVNRMLAELNGRSAEAHVGLRVEEIFDTKDVADRVVASARRVLETGQPVMNEEMQGRSREPHGPRTWLLSYYPVRTRDGTMLGVGGVVTEITERKRMEEELRRTKQVAEVAYEEARQAVRSRDDYLAIVAHDLRTPLVSIALSADGVKNNLPIQSGGAARQLAEHILRATRRMERLIQDLLDAARIEGGRMALEVRPHPLDSLLRDAADLLSPLAKERGVQLSVESAGEPVNVLADKERVSQVLSNLVGNALKFTPRGGAVTVLAEGLGDLVR
ncbi:MAG TPA: PAS domain-containing sensor histidine kinase, partial [Myxococcaceae bacterium]|nr:PAS domain-containing sensor histidine kinase [Myxococcaceae bacterium]